MHQYLIPGIQVGVKVSGNVETGNIESVFSVARPVFVDDPEVKAPSVITLHGTAAAYAANEFLFSVVGLKREATEYPYTRFVPQTGEISRAFPRRDVDCPECGETPESRFGRGDSRSLPTRG